jgi:Ner family transcriptional regulator
MASNTPKKASLQDWHPADIKAALQKKGWTIRALAAQHGVSGTTISHTFLRSYPINERRIADAIGVPPQHIWPTRYNEDGSMKPRGIKSCSPQVHASKCIADGLRRNGNEKQAA